MHVHVHTQIHSLIATRRNYVKYSPSHTPTETMLGEKKRLSMWLFIGCCQAATICSLHYNRFMMSVDCKFEWITEYDDIKWWPSANSIITRVCLQSIVLQCWSVFTRGACPHIVMSHSERETHRPRTKHNLQQQARDIIMVCFQVCPLCCSHPFRKCLAKTKWKASNES